MPEEGLKVNLQNPHCLLIRLDSPSLSLISLVVHVKRQVCPIAIMTQNDDSLINLMAFVLFGWLTVPSYYISLLPSIIRGSVCPCVVRALFVGFPSLFVLVSVTMYHLYPMSASCA